MELPTLFQQYIHLSRYARWIDAKGRRETPAETVNRYFDFFEEHLMDNHGFDLKPHRDRLEKSVMQLEAMPSMRALMTAGPALKRENLAGFNCAYIAIDHPRAFDETLYILMCGTGVGFSVEANQVNKLPLIPDELHQTDTTIVVKDSKLGWAVAYKELIGLLYAGLIPKLNTSKVRAAGERLKTFGGRASGPGPLIDLFYFTVEKFKAAKGRKLTPIEVHDIICKVGEVVVVGGVRRSALISLSDLSDQKMREAKSGSWHMADPQRALANNSAVYDGRPDVGTFMDEWQALYKSMSGERGIFNRKAAIDQIQRCGGRRRAFFDEEETKPIQFGLNPCAEIVLRSSGLCNLSEVVARSDDTIDTLREKVAVATILGTIQSSLTNFRYVRKVWKDNAEEERLLGVSITGIMDCPLLSGEKADETLEYLKLYSIEVNENWAEQIGINPSVAVTCVKPSGTVSALCDTASGIHARFSPYYIRRVRGDKKDPLTQFMIDRGFPCEDDIFKPEQTVVFSFPVKAPQNAKCRNDFDAIGELKNWLTVRNNWCEHNPSMTTYIRENEWFSVASWVWDNFDSVSGLSFLPYSEHNYQQAPFEEIDENAYNELASAMPVKVDWSEMSVYENEDHTTSSQELACVAGVCEVQ